MGGRVGCERGRGREVEMKRKREVWYQGKQEAERSAGGRKGKRKRKGSSEIALCSTGVFMKTPHPA